MVEFDLIYGQGISKVGEIVDLGVDMGIIGKSGSWFNYGETKIGQGREAVKTLLLDNPELAAEIEKKIRDMAKGDDAVIPVDMSIPEDGEDTL